MQSASTVSDSATMPKSQYIHTPPASTVSDDSATMPISQYIHTPPASLAMLLEVRAAKLFKPMFYSARFPSHPTTHPLFVLSNLLIPT